MKVAAVSWQLRAASNLGDYKRHLERLLREALARGADCVVFPENTSLELLHAHPDCEPTALASCLSQYWEALCEHALEVTPRGVTVLAGTHFAVVDGRSRNLALVVTADGRLVTPGKVVLTQYESNEWGLSPSCGLVRLQEPPCGVTVCYDCEFPESGRALAEAGALIQFVPSYTETRHGFNRVRACCHARAVENQVFVVHASLVGDLGREPVPFTCGASAILAPNVEPFPPDGVLSQTPLNIEAIAVAELDLGALPAVRESGDVRNWNDRGLGSWSVTKL